MRLRVGHRSATRAMPTTTPPMMSHRLRGVKESPCRTFSPARSRIQSRLIGSSTFQPRRMNWSYRRRGSVARTHTNMNSISTTLATNHSSGNQPLFAPAQNAVIGHGARQPPRNIVTIADDIDTIATYSESMYSRNLIELYSVM